RGLPWHGDLPCAGWDGSARGSTAIVALARRCAPAVESAHAEGAAYLFSWPGIGSLTHCRSEGRRILLRPFLTRSSLFRGIKSQFAGAGVDAIRLPKSDVAVP